MKLKIAIIPVLILMGGFALMFLLISQKSEAPERHINVQPKIVETTEVKFSDVFTKIVAYGRLTSSQPVILYSEVSGKLKQGSIPFQPAQSFKKGDLLLKIDDRQLLFDINSAKSDFLTALATVLPEFKVDFPEVYEKWQSYFNSCSFDKNLDPLPESTNPKLKMYLSRYNVYKLYFNVRNLEIRLEKHFFYAPFKGSIVSAELRVGSTARVGTKLGEIINLENPEVEIPLRVEEIQWIDKRKPVIFTSSEIKGSWEGTILRIGKHIEDRTQTVPVFVSLKSSQPNNLFNGTFFQAQIQGKVIPQAFVVPRKALYNGKYVYIISDGKLNYKEVQIAREETDSVIITGGLETGDKLVTEILQGVSPGMPAKSKSSVFKGGNK